MIRNVVAHFTHCYWHFTGNKREYQCFATGNGLLANNKLRRNKAEGEKI